MGAIYVRFVRGRPVVGADEMRLRIVRDKSGKTMNGFVWTSTRDDDGGLKVADVFAEDRSLVDAFRGYNVVDEGVTEEGAPAPSAARARIGSG